MRRRGTAAIAVALALAGGTAFAVHATADKPSDRIDPAACAYVQGGIPDLGPSPSPTTSPEGYAAEQARQAFGDGQAPRSHKGKRLKLKVARDNGREKVLTWVDDANRVNATFKFVKTPNGWVPDMQEACSPVASVAPEITPPVIVPTPDPTVTPDETPGTGR